MVLYFYSWDAHQHKDLIIALVDIRRFVSVVLYMCAVMIEL